MTVDLTKLKAGDSVRILDSVIEVERIWYKPFNVMIKFKNHYDAMHYFTNGKYNDDGRDTPFDILEIIPAPFDWDKVKQGDAFEWHDGEIVYFIAHDFTNEKAVITTRLSCKVLSDLKFCLKQNLTPRPDIPNAKRGV
jgi:hypothetical protein